MRYIWETTISVEADDPEQAARLLEDHFGVEQDEWCALSEHIAAFPPSGPHVDTIEDEDAPDCTCPADLVARGGFTSSCPACAR